MPKPNAQKGEGKKERFTLRLDPILAAKIKALSKAKGCSIISIFENALQHYFSQMSAIILLEHDHAEQNAISRDVE